MATWVHKPSNWDGSSPGSAYSRFQIGKGFIWIDTEFGSSRPNRLLGSSDGGTISGYGDPWSGDILPSGYGTVPYGNGQFAIGARDGSHNKFYKSSSGISGWSSVNLTTFGAAAGFNMPFGILYSDYESKWYAGNQRSSPGPIVCGSTDDGATWTAITTDWDAIAGSQIWGGAQTGAAYVLVGTSSVNSALHYEFTPNWVSTSTALDGGFAYQVLEDDQVGFIAVGANGAGTHQITQSNEGVAWFNKGAPFPGGEALCIVKGFDRFYIGGYASAPGTTVVSTQDFITYTNEECPLDAQVNTLAFDLVNGRLMAQGVQSGGGTDAIYSATIEEPAPIYHTTRAVLGVRKNKKFHTPIHMDKQNVGEFYDIRTVSEGVTTQGSGMYWREQTGGGIYQDAAVGGGIGWQSFGGGGFFWDDYESGGMFWDDHDGGGKYFEDDSGGGTYFDDGADGGIYFDLGNTGHFGSGPFSSNGFRISDNGAGFTYSGWDAASLFAVAQNSGGAIWLLARANIYDFTGSAMTGDAIAILAGGNSFSTGGSILIGSRSGSYNEDNSLWFGDVGFPGYSYSGITAWLGGSHVHFTVTGSAGNPVFQVRRDGTVHIPTGTSIIADL